MMPALKKNTEPVLWTLRNGERVAEARIEGDGRELRIYTGTGAKTGEYVLMFTQLLQNTRGVREMAESKRQEFIARGWS